jgi:hypothetical protein
MAVDPTTPSPPVQDGLAPEHSREEIPQEEQNGSSPSQLLEPDQGGNSILRNAPTFRDDNAAEPVKQHATTAGAADAAEKPKPPSLVTKVTTKVTQKLGLNDILLKSMFKSVYPSSRPAIGTQSVQIPR